MGHTQICWYCCQCGDGPCLDWYSSCLSCNAQRCSNCMVDDTDSLSNLERRNLDVPTQATKIAHSITTSPVAGKEASSLLRTKTDLRAYISETVNVILHYIPLDELKNNQHALSRLCERLPCILKRFAIRLATFSQLEPSEDILAHSNIINQHKYTIAATIASGFKIKSPYSLQGEALNEPHVPRLNAESADETVDYGPSAGASSDVNEQANRSVDLEENLRRYRATMTSSTARNYWLTKIHFELYFVRLEPAAGSYFDRSSVLEQILQKLCPHEKWGALEPIKVHYRLDWNPRAFYEQHDYDVEYDDFVEQAVVLIGAGKYAQFTTVSEYLHQCWPHLADLVLAALKCTKDLGTCDNLDAPYSLHLQDFLDRSPFVNFYAFGSVDWIAEIGEVLTWLGSALRAPTEHCKVMHCKSSVNIVPCNPASRKDKVAYNIYCVFNQQPAMDLRTTTTPGYCWQDMFLNSIVATGYPVPDSDIVGLELSLPLMATLTGATRITQFGSRLFFKGFSSMLVLTRKTNEACQWHYLFNEDGSRIRYSDPRVREVMPLELEDISTFESWIGLMRHGIGWCRDVRWFIGSTDANYDIGRARLDKIPFKCAFDRVTIAAGFRATASASAAIGKKNRPVHVRNEHYVTRLKGIDKGFINMYDGTAHRAWLIDGASGLLHLVQASLQKEQAGKFTHDSECDVQQCVKDITKLQPCENAIEILRDNEFLNIRLYKNPDEIEEFEETVTEITSADAIPKETIKRVVKKHQSWYCIKNRVEELCSILEQLMDHQADIACEDGVGFNIRLSPRKQLEGFQFQDLVSNKAPLRSGVVTLRSEGKSWVDFNRAISAVTLFGNGFGELLKPAHETTICTPWTSVPTGRDCLVVPTSVLREIITDYAEDTVTSAVELIDGIYWYVPETLFAACRCTADSTSQHHDDPVQVLVPSTFLEELKIFSGKGKSDQNPGRLEDGGAVIFGKSPKFPLCWGDRGDPELGQLSMKERLLSGPLRADSASCQPVAEGTSSEPSRPNTTGSEETNDCTIPIRRRRRASESLTGILKRIRN